MDLVNLDSYRGYISIGIYDLFQSDIAGTLPKKISTENRFPDFFTCVNIQMMVNG